MNARRAWLYAVLALWISGCTKNDLPDVFSLGSLRILAIKSAPAEVDPSSGAVSVTLQPVVSNLDAAQTTIAYSLEACLDPGVSLGAYPDCSADPTRPAKQTGTLTVDSPTYTGATHETLTVAVPTTVYAGKTTAQKYNGVAYLVILTLTNPSGESTRAVHRLIATTRTPINQNPTITSIKDRAGVSLSALPNGDTWLIPAIGAGAEESYTQMLVDGTLQNKNEQATVSWFIADGHLDFSRTGIGSENFWVPPGLTTRPVFLYAVIRDDRGGAGYLPSTVGP